MEALSRLACLAVVIAAVAVLPATASEFFVGPNGSATAEGSITSPWSLAHALSGAAGRIKPGDKVYLRAGTYTGNFTSQLAGTAAAPIVVRNYGSEAVKLTSASGTTLSVYGSFTWIWGLEVTQSGTDYTDGLDVQSGDGHKVINCVIHDTGCLAMYVAAAAPNAEIYGTLTYLNGTAMSTPGKGGYGIYTQNLTGEKFLTDNVFVNDLGNYPIHIYTQDGGINNFRLTGNVTAAGNAAGRWLLIGGGQVALNPILKENTIYNIGLDLGYQLSDTGARDAIVQNNDIITNFVRPFNCNPNNQNTTISSNRIYGDIVGFTQSQYPNNTYFSARPTGQWIRVRPNKYEPGRAHIIIFNWSGQSTAAVDLSLGALQVGDTYEIRDSQNFFGPVLLRGTYSGGAVNLPLTGLSLATPRNVPSVAPAPAHTSSEFNTFILIKTASGTPVNQPPVVNAGADQSVTLPALASLSATVSDDGLPAGGSLTQAWSKVSGPGTVSFAAPTSKTTSASFSTAGVYVLRLTASDSVLSASDTLQITVSAAATAFSQYLEAESGTLTAPMTARADTSASAGRYVTTDTADSGTVSLIVNLPSAGSYILWGRILSPADNADSLYVSVDGGAEDIWDMAENLWSPTWQYTRVTGRAANGGVPSPLNANPRLFSLSAGAHVFTFRGRELNAKFDRLFITNDANARPSGAQPANQPPLISSTASASPNPATAGQAISFTVAASDPDGDALSYRWSFGDGASAAGASSTHAYAAPGTFTATVNISDGSATISSSVTVTVSAAATNTVSVTKAGTPLSGVYVYAYSATGAYLGKNALTNSLGQATFSGLAAGLEVKYSVSSEGASFWSAVVRTPQNASIDVPAPSTVTVLKAGTPLASVYVYVFDAAGTYLNYVRKTDATGRALFAIRASQQIKFRVSDQGAYFWSTVLTTPTTTTIALPATSTVTVKKAGVPLKGLYVYVFNAAGTYLNYARLTDATGTATFALAAGTQVKFRVSEQGAYFWSPLITAPEPTTISVPTSTTVSVNKGGAALAGVYVYGYDSLGKYLNYARSTDTNGQARFALNAGQQVKFRVVDGGVAYWSPVISAPGTASIAIPAAAAALASEEAAALPVLAPDPEPQTATASIQDLKFSAAIALSDGRGACTISGVLLGGPTTGTNVNLDIGGALLSLTCDASGKARGAQGTLALKSKRTKAVKFMARIQGSGWSELWAQHGLDSTRSLKHQNVTLPISIELDGVRYQSEAPAFWSVTAGKSGRLRN